MSKNNDLLEHDRNWIKMLCDQIIESVNECNDIVYVGDALDALQHCHDNIKIITG